MLKNKLKFSLYVALAASSLGSSQAASVPTLTFERTTTGGANSANTNTTIGIQELNNYNHPFSDGLISEIFDTFMMPPLISGASKTYTGIKPPPMGSYGTANLYDVSYHTNLGGNRANQPLISHSFIRQYTTLYHINSKMNSQLATEYRGYEKVNGKLIAHVTDSRGVSMPGVRKWVYLGFDCSVQTGGMSGGSAQYTAHNAYINVYVNSNKSNSNSGVTIHGDEYGATWTGQDRVTGQLNKSGTVNWLGDSFQGTCSVLGLVGFYVFDKDIVTYDITVQEQLDTQANLVLAGTPASSAQNTWTVTLDGR